MLRVSGPIGAYATPIHFQNNSLYVVEVLTRHLIAHHGTHAIKNIQEQPRICFSASSASSGLSPAFPDSVSTAGAAVDVSGFSEAI